MHSLVCRVGNAHHTLVDLSSVAPLSYAVDSDFPEKRDLEQQMEQLTSRSTHEQADSPMGTAVTSVLPGFKFLHATAVVHPDAVLGEVNHCCTLD